MGHIGLLPQTSTTFKVKGRKKEKKKILEDAKATFKCWCFCNYH